MQTPSPEQYYKNLEAQLNSTESLNPMLVDMESSALEAMIKDANAVLNYRKGLILRARMKAAAQDAPEAAKDIAAAPIAGLSAIAGFFRQVGAEHRRNSPRFL